MLRLAGKPSHHGQPLSSNVRSHSKTPMHPLTVLVGIGLWLIYMGKGFLITVLVALAIGAVATIVYAAATSRSGQPSPRHRESQAPTRALSSLPLQQSFSPVLSERAMAALRGIDLPRSGLIIRPEPLARILDGRKVWEMRSDGNAKLGCIALIEKGGKRILGVAEICEVRGPLSEKAMRETVAMHGIEPERLLDPAVAKLRYAWVLANVRRLTSPVPFRPRSGPVRFVTLNEQEVGAIRDRLP